MKTGKEILTDMYRMLKGSTLAAAINGGVYVEGHRPPDSRKEDAVVIFTAGLPGDIDTGVVTIHVYVPDKDFGNGYLEEDSGRVAEIEQEAKRWVGGLTAEKSCYKFEPRQAICSQAGENNGQHYVVISLKYKFYE